MSLAPIILSPSDQIGILLLSLLVLHVAFMLGEIRQMRRYTKFLKEHVAWLESLPVRDDPVLRPPPPTPR